MEKTKSTNREAESDYVAEVGGMNHIEPGSEWERVSKHCDFSAKVRGIFELDQSVELLPLIGPWTYQGCVTHEVNSAAAETNSPSNQSLVDTKKMRENLKLSSVGNIVPVILKHFINF